MKPTCPALVFPPAFLNLTLHPLPGSLYLNPKLPFSHLFSSSEALATRSAAMVVPSAPPSWFFSAEARSAERRTSMATVSHCQGFAHALELWRQFPMVLSKLGGGAAIGPKPLHVPALVLPSPCKPVDATWDSEEDVLGLQCGHTLMIVNCCVVICFYSLWCFERAL